MIEVRGLTRYYGTTKAVEDLTFSIASNEIVGFLGLNGAGKTTTLKILAGLLLPTAGEVRLDGQDLFSAPLDVRKRIGFLPEEPPLYAEMTVRDFLVHVGLIRGLTREEAESAIPSVAERTGIQEVLDQVIGTLSHGFRKRVGIAQAIVHHPSLVILDEPIAGLDPVQIVEMREMIVGLRATCTVLVSSHILSEVSQTCDRLLILKNGRLAGQGTESELALRARGHARLLLSVRGTREDLARALDGPSEVTGWTVEAEAGAVLTARVDLSGDHAEVVVRRLVEAGVGIRRVVEAEAELEQIFLQLTGEGER
ncbi:MAG: ABC transporter ATP-binding protein [Deltaproteobacteria bacterium]|nr:ABC transporter ATP-binding protein [Deltaproteobacteria bacterium]